MTESSNKTSGRNRYRIIGGNWRSRKLAFPDGVADLRPTSDRIRETLFNWLQQKINGAACLDVFAGSAALAFESCSRGAASVIAIEKHPQAADSIRDNARLLDCQAIQVVNADALKWLEEAAGKYQFDIVYLDPPYKLDLLPHCCGLLESANLLAPGAIIYLESDTSLETLLLPDSWRLMKNKKAGQVFYGVCERPIH